MDLSGGAAFSCPEIEKRPHRGIPDMTVFSVARLKTVTQVFAQSLSEALQGSALFI